MEKNPFLKYLIKEKKEDVLHTSAYAKVQNGAGFGASSSQSFEDRQKIEANRQIVRGYNDSKLMQQARVSAPRATTYVKPAENNGSRFGGGAQGGGAIRGGMATQGGGMRGGATPGTSATQSRPPMQRINPGITRK